MLKNKEQMLPLDIPENMDSIAVIGPLADVWYQDWYGGKAPYTKTLKQGIEDIAGKEIPCADGRDRVIFRYQEKGITIAEDGTLYMSETPDVFIMDDWGEGSFTFRSVRTGKYMNATFPKDEDGEKGQGYIAAQKDEPFDWFVMEIFHLIRQEDGKVQLTERFGSPVQVDENDSLIYRKEGGEATSFSMEIVESGLESACRMAQGRDTIILALGCNSMINAKEEVDRTTIHLPPVQEKLLEKYIR